MQKFNLTIIGYITIASIGLSAVFLVHLKSEKDYGVALEHYKEISQSEADLAAKNISYSLKQLYQGIRTISFLPSVQNIDRYGKNLDSNAHAAIEQIYDNMVSNVAVSEIYIVPVDIEPEKIDKNTGGLQEPILMYDGKVADPTKPEEEKPPITSVEQASHVEEVEIYEYQLLKEHMAYFKQNYPNNKNIDKNNIPFISGSEVLTCDNDDFEKTHKDADRAGAVFSVPFYAQNGELKGSITAVLRNNTIQSMMPASNFALVNETYNYTVLAKDEGQQQKSLEFVSKNQPDSNLFFSATVPVETTDPRSKWSLWAGYPDSRFTESANAKAVDDFRRFGYIASMILTLLMGIIWGNLRRIAVRNARQEIETKKQNKELMKQIASKFQETVQVVILEIASSASKMKIATENVAKIASDTKQKSNIVAKSSEQATVSANYISAASEELSTSIVEISNQAQKSNQISSNALEKAEITQSNITELSSKSAKVAEVIGVITGIAGKINLLALNATIEAARAGEAGKGFAVVASEVKDLASMVAKATGEITAQINEMEDFTKTSVDSVSEIVRVIEQISFGTSTIAGAVEEQTAVAKEITRNIVSSVNDTHDISDNIIIVQEGAEKTENTSHELLGLANNLSGQSDILKEKVTEFLNEIQK